MIDGTGLMIVCAVGEASNIARKRLTIPKPSKVESPLKAHLDRLVIILGKIGLSFGCVMFLILMVYLMVDLVVNESWE